MKYRKQLLDLLFQENDEAMMKWLEAQPLLDQPQIFREMKELLTEIAIDEGADLDALADDFNKFEKRIDKYEDRILDHKLAEAGYIMTLNSQGYSIKNIEEVTPAVRKYIIDCIVTNAPNAKQMRKLAKQIMALEKNSGTFDPANWSPII